MGHGSGEIFYFGGGIPQLFFIPTSSKDERQSRGSTGSPVQSFGSGLFSDQPGLTHVLYHEIDTGDKGPVVSRPYRYDRVKQGIDYHIDKMLRDGTICPINSPYASPVVLTRKKNDLPPDSPEAYRFAIDYRKLNGITKYPRYPLPVIDDLLTNIPHTNVMSTLDLRSGYFQLAISPRDIKKPHLSLAMALLRSYACLLVFLGRYLISNGQLTLFSNLLLGVSCWCIWTML
ncbi:retrovirus-related Pol polyprotein from transposon 17.6 [Trichonephila clavipes]|nr:retrovirus-related Pol polyprotein from transposon 17.6 [Trichonephila clavipes]